MVECPKCGREIKSLNQWHNCVTTTVDGLFMGKDPDLVLIFDKILAEVSAWEDVKVSTTQNCIVFLHRQTFLIIKPMTKVLDLKFYSEVFLENDMIKKSILYSGRYENHIRLTPAEEIDSKVYTYLRKSYELL